MLKLVAMDQSVHKSYMIITKPAGDDHDHGQVGVNQRQGAVLQLPGQDALAAIFDINDSLFDRKVC